MKDNFSFKTTAEIKVSNRIVDQVIGQKEAVDVVKKAAQQRRHLLLIGEPGTGKSMIGQALAELLPKERLVDVLCFPNPLDENQPLIRSLPATKGRDMVSKAKMQTMKFLKGQNIIFFVLAILAMIVPWWVRARYNSDVMFAAFFIGGMFFLVSFMIFLNMGRRAIAGQNPKADVPKLLVDNAGRTNSPFLEATGAHAGALLGDVLHDPLQSGGLGTPAHERVVAGMIHKANGGVLFVDEIATLHPAMQQELLTALQEGKYPITGQSERSSGAMVRTEPVPCDFVLVAAGNVETIQHMHPALRSRIRGYGYDVFMKETALDTPENRMAIARFVAQEVNKDKKIPHFSRAAVLKIIEEAKRMANRKAHLTLRFRDLGGLIRAAGDVAREKKNDLVEPIHIELAKKVARPLEQQVADKFIERKKEYEVIITEGVRVGRVNGLAVIGSAANFSGIVLPIESEVAPGGKEKEIVATGKLGTIAKEAVKNIGAIVKKLFGTDIKKYDLYVQFLQTYEGVEGDSASIAVATSIISALKGVPVRQDTALTGSLSVRGDVLPIGGVSAKIEAAIEAGIKRVVIPRTNMKDIVVAPEKLKKVKVIPVDHVVDVLREVLDWHGKRAVLQRITSLARTNGHKVPHPTHKQT